jgi:hypothetical protein
MAKYLTRKCPRCKDSIGILILPHLERTVDLVIDGYCSRCGYELHWLALAGGRGLPRIQVNGPVLRLAPRAKQSNWRPISKGLN